jgi:hypothetical protein
MYLPIYPSSQGAHFDFIDFIYSFHFIFPLQFVLGLLFILTNDYDNFPLI